MVLLMINEAARCLEEQVVTDPADVDFAMIMGTGFAPFRGGPLRYADTVGIANLVAKMDQLASSGAPHFAPCALLRSMAASGKGFYPQHRFPRIVSSRRQVRTAIPCRRPSRLSPNLPPRSLRQSRPWQKRVR